MKRFLAGLLLFLAFFCSGCQAQPRSDSSQAQCLVTQIIITHKNGKSTAIHSYSSDDSMSRILDFFRTAKLQEVSQLDPGQLPGSEYVITAVLWNGNTHTYLLKNRQYLQTRSGKWMQLDPEQTAVLPRLFSSLPADR